MRLSFCVIMVTRIKGEQVEISRRHVAQKDSEYPGFRNRRCVSLKKRYILTSPLSDAIYPDKRG